MTRRAKLTSELLVRKGQAMPTGGFAHGGIDLCQPLPGPARLEMARGNGVLASATFGARPKPAPAPKRRAEAADQDRVALTLRLDRERHRRLKVFCARGQRTTQEVLIEALDAYLEACGADCACTRAEPEDCTRN
jgi:hypothetical protein